MRSAVLDVATDHQRRDQAAEFSPHSRKRMLRELAVPTLFVGHAMPGNVRIRGRLFQAKPEGLAVGTGRLRLMQPTPDMLAAYFVPSAFQGLKSNGIAEVTVR